MKKPTQREQQKDLENRRRYVDEQTRANAKRTTESKSDEVRMKSDMEQKTYEYLEYQKRGPSRSFFSFPEAPWKKKKK